MRRRPGVRSTAEEADLVERLVRGDGRALGSLLRLYRDRVYTLCYRVLGDARLAADSSRRAFLDLQRDLLARRIEGSLEQGLYRRALRRCRVLASRAGDRTTEEGGSPGPGAGGGGCRDITDALLELSLIHREVLVLRDLLHLDYGVVASVLGLSSQALGTRLHHARTELARAYYSGSVSDPDRGQLE